MTIGWSSTGSFKKTDKFFERMLKGAPFKDLDRFAKAGEQALRDATPVESGETRGSWYSVVRRVGRYSYRIEWRNSHVVDGAVIAVLIQYGHGTGTGGYVPAVDYVNPAMRPLADMITERVWKEVTSDG